MLYGTKCILNIIILNSKSAHDVNILIKNDLHQPHSVVESTHLHPTICFCLNFWSPSALRASLRVRTLFNYKNFPYFRPVLLILSINKKIMFCWASLFQMIKGATHLMEIILFIDFTMPLNHFA